LQTRMGRCCVCAGGVPGGGLLRVVGHVGSRIVGGIIFSSTPRHRRGAIHRAQIHRGRVMGRNELRPYQRCFHTARRYQA
jgi:hypothetical protein